VALRVRQNLDESEPARVDNRHVDELPRPALALAAPIAGDPIGDTPKTSEFRDLGLNELAGAGGAWLRDRNEERVSTRRPTSHGPAGPCRATWACLSFGRHTTLAHNEAVAMAVAGRTDQRVSRGANPMRSRRACAAILLAMVTIGWRGHPARRRSRSGSPVS
jgi:hypothetical protein